MLLHQHKFTLARKGVEERIRQGDLSAYDYAVSVLGDLDMAAYLVRVVQHNHQRTERPPLTTYEQVILLMVAKGRGVGDIAKLLHLKKRSVYEHLARIYQKLDVAGIAEAVVKALTHQIITLDQLKNLTERPENYYRSG